jgi:hypothetical protein
MSAAPWSFPVSLLKLITSELNYRYGGGGDYGDGASDAEIEEVTAEVNSLIAAARRLQGSPNGYHPEEMESTDEAVVVFHDLVGRLSAADLDPDGPEPALLEACKTLLGLLVVPNG